MTENRNKLASLEALEALARRAKDVVDGVSTRVKTLEDAGYQTGTQVQEAINARLSSTYKAGGSLDSPDASKLAGPYEGFVFNVSNKFTTTENFVDGLNRSYPAGTNIVVIKEGDTYKFDVLAGFVDLSEADKGSGVSVTIPTTGWGSDSTATYSKYYDFSVTGITASDRADVQVSPAGMAAALACGLCPVTETLAGKIRIRAASVPSASIAAQYWVEKGA